MQPIRAFARKQPWRNFRRVTAFLASLRPRRQEARSVSQSAAGSSSATMPCKLPAGRSSRFVQVIESVSEPSGGSSSGWQGANEGRKHCRAGCWLPLSEEGVD